MSFNLVDAAKSLISSDLINKASTFLGENESSVDKAISGLLPTVLGGLADKTATHEGAEMVARLAGEQHQSGILDNLTDFFGAESSTLLNSGGGIANGIFGDKASGLTNLLSSFSGVKSSSVGSLLGMITPIVLGFLGKHASSNHLNPDGLTSLLNSQTDNISKAIPAGLNLSSVFGNNVATAASVPHTSKSIVQPVTHLNGNAGAISDSGNSYLRYLLPAILFAILAAAAWYLFGAHKNTASEEGAHIVMDSSASPDVVKQNDVAKGAVDTTGNFVYELGKMVTIDLPNGAGSLTVGENSTENKLVRFLSDPASVIDTVKGNWFEFTNVRFLTGGTQVDSASAIQLKNIVAISKGFPEAGFKLGGYTDNTGDSVANIALSQRRSDAVVAALKKMGASANSITGAKGYGPQYPIGDNSTAEGRAMNRRVAINVKHK